MKMKLNPILTAIAASGMLASGAASAGWTAVGTTTNVIEEGTAAAKAVAAMVADVDAVYTLDAGASLTANDTITIALTGGLTFGATTPTLTGVGGCNLGSGNNAAAVPLTGGTAGTTTATWRAINDFCVAGNPITMNSASATIFDASAITSGATADMEISLATSTGIDIGAPNQSLAAAAGTPAVPPFTGINMTTTTLTASTDTVRVASTPAYAWFNNTSTDQTGTAAVLTFTNNADPVTTVPTLAGGAVQANDLVVTLAGNMSGIATIGCTGLETAPAAADNQCLIDATAGTAVGSNAGNNSFDGGAVLAVAPVWNLDGTTQQEARSFTAAAALAAATNFNAVTVLSATNVYNIVRDGFSFNTGWVGTSSANLIRIRDLSNTLSAAGATINVTLTYYDASGAPTVVGPTALTTTLPNGGDVAMTPAEIIAEMGASVPTGLAARFSFAVETTTGWAGNKKQVGGVGLDTKITTNGGTNEI